MHSGDRSTYPGGQVIPSVGDIEADVVAARHVRVCRRRYAGVTRAGTGVGVSVWSLVVVEVEFVGVGSVLAAVASGMACFVVYVVATPEGALGREFAGHT